MEQTGVLGAWVKGGWSLQSTAVRTGNLGEVRRSSEVSSYKTSAGFQMAMLGVDEPRKDKKLWPFGVSWQFRSNMWFCIAGRESGH